jgi:hypothetical protein
VLALDSAERLLSPVYFIDPYQHGGFGVPTYAAVSGLGQFLWFLFQKELGERRWPFMLEFVMGHDPDLAQVKSALMPWLADEQSRTRTLPAKQSKR